MRVKFQNIDGVETRYYIAGEGPPLMLVHGGGVSADSWIRNLPELARHFTVVVPDTLGHGFTDAGALDGGPPQPHMVRHLCALADHLGWQRFSVCGSSYGAQLAILTYFALPDRVAHLVLISSASATLSEAELKVSLDAAYRNGSSAIFDPTYENCRARMARINYSDHAVPPEVLLMQLNIYSRPNAGRNYDLVMKGLMRLVECRPYRVAERFAEIAIPTLLVWGKDDQRVLMSRAIDAARAMPLGRLVALEGCRHEPHMEHPEKFNALVQEFLQQRDPLKYRVGAHDEVTVI
jgi:2-hydroxy-6-oxonona-2,4-dienedioate hydrolase